MILLSIMRSHLNDSFHSEVKKYHRLCHTSLAFISSMQMSILHIQCTQAYRSKCNLINTASHAPSNKVKSCYNKAWCNGIAVKPPLQGWPPWVLWGTALTGQGAFAFLFQWCKNCKNPLNDWMRARRNGIGSTDPHHFINVSFRVFKICFCFLQNRKFRAKKMHLC